MEPTPTPFWVWGFVVIVMLPAVGGLLLALALEFKGAKPRRSVRVGDVKFELWVKERRYPASADAIVVPVAPDLKMVTGIAKWVRDATANRLQSAADAVAPLSPGEAFVGAGGRYRFKIAALAVVMDDKKQTSPEWISGGLANALKLSSGRDARSVMVPDFTEDLLRQPNWITDEQRRETCAPIARAMIDGILAGSAGLETIKIWVWRTGNQDIFERELASLESRQADVRFAHLVEG